MGADQPLHLWLFHLNRRIDLMPGESSAAFCHLPKCLTQQVTRARYRAGRRSRSGQVKISPTGFPPPLSDIRKIGFVLASNPVIAISSAPLRARVARGSLPRHTPKTVASSEPKTFWARQPQGHCRAESAKQCGLRGARCRSHTSEFRRPITATARRSSDQRQYSPGHS